MFQRIDSDWEGGETAFLEALELNPNYPQALGYYSNLLCILEREVEAVAQAERALELDPFNSLIMGLYANTLTYLRRYDDAIVQAQNALMTSPNDPIGHSILWEAHHMKEQYEDALEDSKAFFAGLGFDPIVEAIDRGFEKEGYEGAMRSAAEIFIAFSQQTYISPWQIAHLYAFAGEKELTLDWLEKGYEVRDPNKPYTGGIGNLFDSILHDNPRFQNLLRKIGLPVTK